jgi:hypothetical protein
MTDDVWSGLDDPQPQNTVAPDIWSHLEAGKVPASTGAASVQSASDAIPLESAAKGIVGMGENVLSGVTGGAGSLADALTLSDPGTHDWAYRPKTEAGQQLAKAINIGAGKVGNAYDAAFGTGPLATTIKERVPEALGAVGTVTGAAGLAKGVLRPSSFTADDVAAESSHPLQGVADAETARISQAVAKGRAAGMELPDRTITPTQGAANQIIRDEFNMPGSAPITPKMLDAVRQNNYAPGYQAVEKIPKVQLGSAYEDDIGNVDLSAIKDKYQPPPGGSITGARAVDLSKYLREKASAYFQEGTVDATEKGQAHWDAAQAVEDAVERRLKATGQAQTATDWDNARVGYAKTYSVQSALDGAGNVVVPKLKSQLIRGKPLSGGLEDLATMGAVNPEAFKATPQAPKPSLLRRIGARSAPMAGAAVGAYLGGPLAPLTGAAGAELGQNIGEQLLRRP